MICDRPDMGPNDILSTGPRVRRDATGRTLQYSGVVVAAE